MRRNPHLYEINAGVFLWRLSQKYGHAFTLGVVPELEWRALARHGFDLVWLMGVWQRSPAARQQALQNLDLRRQYDEVLPGWTERDVGGSPYAIYAYRLDEAMGREAELAKLKSVLNRLGLGLVLDFVPNHLALDHPWTLSHPDWFVRGTQSEVSAHPDWFYSHDGEVYLAHGKDPYFPPWTDTVQVNFFSTGLRQALVDELLRIAEVADGVRCDVAMLALSDVFEGIWGRLVKDSRPETEFWTEAIARVKHKHPEFVFIAEVYWGLEKKLQQLGFDFVYDKVLYDCLRFSTPTEIRRYLAADDIPWRRARFIENHDELRAVAAFGRERSLAAAVVLATLPGLRLFHDGQQEGRKVRLPVQLRRESDEAVDSELAGFYSRLLDISNAPAFHEGEWGLLDVYPVWEGDGSSNSLLAWSWKHKGRLEVVAVNYSPYRSQARLKLPLISSQEVCCRDKLTGSILKEEPEEVRGQGLHVDLEPWRACILDFDLGV